MSNNNIDNNNINNDDTEQYSSDEIMSGSNNDDSFSSKDSSNESDSSDDKSKDNNNVYNEFVENVCTAAMQATEAVTLAATALLEYDNMIPDINAKTWGGSRPGKAPNKDRNFIAAYEQLIKDYFSGSESVYSEVNFKTRFRVSRVVFNRVYSVINGIPPFLYRKDAVGKYGIHPLVRLTACFRSLGYGDAFDREDENLRLSATSQNYSVKSFCEIIIDKFGEQYMNRNPTKEEKDIILEVNKNRGFPGMLASWDCSHFQWNKCPMKLDRQFKNGRTSMCCMYLLYKYQYC